MLVVAFLALVVCSHSIKVDVINEAAPSGTIYAISFSQRLNTVDKTTGALTPVGPAQPTALFAQELSTIDSQRGVYYGILVNASTNVISLVGLSLSTGQIVSSVPLPFAAESWVGVGQTCNAMPETGEVLVTGRNSDGLHHLYRVNPTTKQLVQLAKIGGGDILSGISAYDASQQLLWVEYTAKNESSVLFAFDANSGQLVHEIPNIPNLETLDYDPATELLFGIGLVIFPNNTGIRSLATLNSKTTKFNIIGTFPDFIILNGDIASIDVQKRLLYAYLQYDSSTAIMNLLSIDMRTAKVVTASPIKQQSNIPWSLEVYNAPSDL